jgi:hypothetical protein
MFKDSTPGRPALLPACLACHLPAHSPTAGEYSFLPTLCVLNSVVLPLPERPRAEPAGRPGWPLVQGRAVPATDVRSPPLAIPSHTQGKCKTLSLHFACGESLVFRYVRDSKGMLWMHILPVL